MSSGGRLAIDFTLTYSDKVEGLVLVGAVVGGFGYTSHMNNRGGHFDPILPGRTLNLPNLPKVAVRSVSEIKVPARFLSVNTIFRMFMRMLV
jgi:pimeloyl-ACP methyl ester carboxylesterase